MLHKIMEKYGLGLAALAEKWFPDALVFAFLGVLATFLLGICVGETPAKLAFEGGKSFWSLIPFTMQMAMVIIGGYIVADAPLVHKLIVKLASLPRTPRGAIAFTAFFSIFSSLLSWGFSLIFSGLLVRELARRVKGMDYRAAGAAAYLGLGSVWALGLSSSAALLMATKSAIPPKLYEISGVIPLSATLFLWQSIFLLLALASVAIATAYFSAPEAEHAVTAAALDVAPDTDRKKEALEPRTRPGEWLEYSPLLNIAIGILLAAYLVMAFKNSPNGALAALDLNTYNLMFLTAGIFLHASPRRFMRAAAKAIPAAGGVLVQFPFYAVIFGMITGTAIAPFLADLFVRVSTHNTYPLLAALYSSTLGVFIPSGGSKWIVEAPYVLQAAAVHQVNMGWIVQIYNTAEALPNLVNPFWMLPLLAILGVKARDIVGYSFLQLLTNAPVVFGLCWFLARTIPYVPAVH
jgi:short-chain fatty acids transporter